MSKSRGFVYAAVGQKYVDEAAQSARTLRKHHPKHPIALVTDADAKADALFDEVILIDDPKKSIEDKLQMDLAPFDRTLFLDTDTLIAADVSDVFDLLDSFDLVFHQPSMGYHYKLDGVPHSFPEPNTGVIGWRKSEAISAFFELWRTYFKEYESEMSREWDQRSFRHAAIASKDLRLGILPYEYNFMPYWPIPAMRNAMILHGRPFDMLQSVAKSVNESHGARTYVPRVGIVKHYSSHSLGELAGLSMRYAALFGWQALRRAKNTLQGRGR